MSGGKERSNGIRAHDRRRTARQGHSRPAPGKVRARARRILAPRTGKPVGADDRFFTGLNDQLSDKGFLVAVSDDLITWARTGSLMWMTLRLACCGGELSRIEMRR